MPNSPGIPTGLPTAILQKSSRGCHCWWGRYPVSAQSALLEAPVLTGHPIGPWKVDDVGSHGGRDGSQLGVARANGIRRRPDEVSRLSVINALAESFVDSFKTELIGDRIRWTRSQHELTIVERIGWFNLPACTKRTMTGRRPRPNKHLLTLK